MQSSASQEDVIQLYCQRYCCIVSILCVSLASNNSHNSSFDRTYFSRYVSCAMADDPQYEDQVIRRVFAISLRDHNADAAANPPVIYLQDLAEARMAIFQCYLLRGFEANMNG